MSLFIAGMVAIALEVILLLIWAYSIFLKPNGTDPAGQGTAIVFLLALAGYIVAGVLLLLSKKFWPMVLVLVMAAIPLGIVIIGLVKEYGSAKKY